MSAWQSGYLNLSSENEVQLEMRSSAPVASRAQQPRVAEAVLLGIPITPQSAAGQSCELETHFVKPDHIFILIIKKVFALK